MHFYKAREVQTDQFADVIQCCRLCSVCSCWFLVLPLKNIISCWFQSLWGHSRGKLNSFCQCDAADWFRPGSNNSITMWDSCQSFILSLCCSYNIFHCSYGLSSVIWLLAALSWHGVLLLTVHCVQPTHYKPTLFPLVLLFTFKCLNCSVHRSL